MNSWQSNYNRFQRLFHRGEQIVVGFREDYTHGYITKIDETGFGLFQLGKPKEYWYDWDHFEFISHPGFRFKKLPNIGEEWIDNVNIFTIKLLEQFKFTINPIERDIPVHFQFRNSDDVIACVNKFNLKLKDFVRFEAESPWGNLTIKINNGESCLNAHQSFVQTLPQLDGNFDIIKIYFFDDDQLRFDNIPRTAHKWVRDKNELDIMRLTNIRAERSYVSSGDPWFTDESVEKVGFNIWKSKDGYAMSHAKAIIVEVVCDSK